MSILREIDDLIFTALRRSANPTATEFVIVIPARRHAEAMIAIDELRHGGPVNIAMQQIEEQPYRGARLCYSHDAETRIKIYEGAP